MNRILSGLFFVTALTCSPPLLSAKDDKETRSFEMTKAERDLLELLNKERDKNKLPALQPHPLLFKAARAHSENGSTEASLSRRSTTATDASTIAAPSAIRHVTCSSRIRTPSPIATTGFTYA